MKLKFFPTNIHVLIFNNKRFLDELTQQPNNLIWSKNQLFVTVCCGWFMALYY